MRGARLVFPNGKQFQLIARSGSYALIWQSLPEELRTVPASPVVGGVRWHPIAASPYAAAAAEGEAPEGMACLVRDPVERFRSACARQNVTPEVGLSRLTVDVHFWPLQLIGVIHPNVTHFRFPEQIDACAEWLGLPTPVPTLNEEAEEGKPVLTPEEEAAVRAAYASDIALWESLNAQP